MDKRIAIGVAAFCILAALVAVVGIRPQAKPAGKAVHLPRPVAEAPESTGVSEPAPAASVAGAGAGEPVAVAVAAAEAPAVPHAGSARGPLDDLLASDDPAVVIDGYRRLEASGEFRNDPQMQKELAQLLADGMDARSFAAVRLLSLCDPSDPAVRDAVQERLFDPWSATEGLNAVSVVESWMNEADGEDFERFADTMARASLDPKIDGSVRAGALQALLMSRTELPDAIVASVSQALITEESPYMRGRIAETMAAAGNPLPAWRDFVVAQLREAARAETSEDTRALIDEQIARILDSGKSTPETIQPESISRGELP